MRPEASSVGRRRARARHDGHGAGHGRWIVSYADFITLLFAFFTALYGISTVDAAKLGSAASGLRSAFSGGSDSERKAEPAALTDQAAAPEAGPAPMAAAPDTPPDPRVPGEAAEVDLEDVRLRLNERLSESVEGELVAIELDRRGLVVSIRESGSFATGSAEVSQHAKGVIGEVAAAVRGVGNLVRIEGHTDDVPIHTPRYASNWELSTARATNVVALLVGVHGVDASRLSAAGYSQFHPRVPNDSDGNRARNRRVDIVILNPEVGRSEEPGAAQPAQLPAPGPG